MERYNVSQEVLRTDVAGMPLEWIDYRDAVRLYHTEQVAYACGTSIYKVRGGVNALTGLRSVVDVSSIIATHGNTHSLERNTENYSPPLNNQTLFRRDGHLCMYCAQKYRASAHAVAVTITRAVRHPSRRACSSWPCRSHRPTPSTST